MYVLVVEQEVDVKHEVVDISVHVKDDVVSVVTKVPMRLSKIQKTFYRSHLNSFLRENDLPTLKAKVKW